jgi:hypothetical protein
MDGEPLEQRLIPGQEFTQGIEKQRLAETARAGEEVIFALVDQPPREPVLST